eukprot:gene14881-20012_t
MSLARFNDCKSEIGYSEGPTGIIVRVATKIESSTLPWKRQDEYSIAQCRIWMENLSLMIPFTPQDYAEMALSTGEYHSPTSY